MCIRALILAGGGCLTLAVAAFPWVVAADPQPEPLGFIGKLEHADDLSAICDLGGMLAVASDEGARVQLLERTGDPRSFLVWPEGTIRLLDADHEIDIEAMARDDGTLYVLGSHSLKRKLIQPDKDYNENRARLQTVSPEPHRHRLYRLELDTKTGEPTAEIESISLRPILARDPILGPFTAVPAVENGVNIEGMAADGSMLYLGFRTPVLREGYVPVMRLTYEAPERYELRFVQLQGRGIRSLVRVDDGFLILARRERGGESVVYHWNGLDMVPGNGVSRGRLQQLIELPRVDGGVPEGMTAVAMNERYYELIVIHDGLPGGHPIRLRLPRKATTHSSR